MAKEVLAMAAELPSAKSRTFALAPAWRANLSLDLASRRAARHGDRCGPPLCHPSCSGINTRTGQKSGNKSSSRQPWTTWMSDAWLILKSGSGI